MAALVVLGAGAQYVRAVRAAPYVATQTVQIILLAPPTASTSQIAAAQANAEGIARLLTSGGLLAASDFDASIAARRRADDPSRVGTTPEAIAGALSAAHDGTAVTLTARWTSAAGAGALLRAALETLQAGALVAEPAVAALTPSGTMLQVQAVGAPHEVAAPDGAAIMLARGDLAARIALGALAGLLAALGGGLLLARRQAVAVSTEPVPGE